MEPDPLASAPRRVEAYLDQILGPLARRLSPFHREELRHELREHLWARIEAYRELGQPEDEAITEALRQFGGAKDFLRQWRREWAGAGRQGMISEISPAARLTLFLSVAAQTTFWLVTALTAFFTKALILIASPGVRMYYLGHRQVTSLGALSEAATWLVFAAVPGAIGLLVGRLTPGRTMGVLVGLGANSICGSLLYWISTWVSPDQHFADSLAPFFFLSTFWIPVACTTAALTGWRGRRSQIRRRA